MHYKSFVVASYMHYILLCIEKTIELWDYKDFNLIHNFKGHSDIVNCISLFKSDRLLISGSSDKTLRIFSIKSCKEFAILNGHKCSVLTVKVMKSNNIAVSGSADYTIRIWNLTTYEQQKVLQGAWKCGPWSRNYS